MRTGPASVSAVVVFPVAKATQGKSFSDYMEARRRFYFDNYFKRVLPSPSGDARARPKKIASGVLSSSSATRCRTSSYNDDRRSRESWLIVLSGEAFAGEYEPVTVALVPLRRPG